MDNSIIDDAKDMAGLVVDEVKTEINSQITKQQIRNKMDKLKLELGDMSHEAREKVHNIKVKATDMADELSSEVKDKAQELKDKVTD